MILRTDLVEASWKILVPKGGRHHPKCRAVAKHGPCNCWAAKVEKRINAVFDIVEPMIRADQDKEDRHLARLELHEIRGEIAALRLDAFNDYRLAVLASDADAVQEASGRLTAYQRALDLLTDDVSPT